MSGRRQGRHDETWREYGRIVFLVKMFTKRNSCMHSPYNQENPTRKFVEWDIMVPKWCFLESLNYIVFTK